IGGEGIGDAATCSDLTAAERALRRKTHETIQRVTTDVELRQQLNTAVSAMMELVNDLYAFSEQTVTGGPARRIDEDVEHAGKVRGRISVSPDTTEGDLQAAALADPAVQTHLAGKSVKKVVVVKGRLVSIVAA